MKIRYHILLASLPFAFASCSKSEATVDKMNEAKAAAEAIEAALEDPVLDLEALAGDLDVGPEFLIVDPFPPQLEQAAGAAAEDSVVDPEALAGDLDVGPEFLIVDPFAQQLE
jgi:hypothetical protein